MAKFQPHLETCPICGSAGNCHIYNYYYRYHTYFFGTLFEQAFFDILVIHCTVFFFDFVLTVLLFFIVLNKAIIIKPPLTWCCFPMKSVCVGRRIFNNQYGNYGSNHARHNIPIPQLRWPVEENYKLIKEKIGLTNFRGYSENSVLQEFWISMLLANHALAIKRETDGIINSTINQKDNKNRYMANMNELIEYLNRHFGEYMDADTLTQKFDIIRCIFDFDISHRVPDKKAAGYQALVLFQEK